MSLRTRSSPCKSRPTRSQLFSVDRLDPRLVLSSTSLGYASIVSPGPSITPPHFNQTLSITSTTPANSSVLSSSPLMVQVNFDRPIDDFSLGNDDFQLLHLASDGSTSLLLPNEALLSESLDPDGHQVDLSLSRQLVQGNYELTLKSGSQLQGVDGSPLASSDASLVLSEFGIKLPENGLGSATDLKTIVPGTLSMTGQLGTAGHPTTQQYYRFEVADGHHWRVGLEVSSLDDAPTPDASLSLLDSLGHPIATGNLGSLSDPNSPYLFAGLDAGTYYVEVSSPTNAVDASGSSNLVGSASGLNSPGVPFRLDLAADLADQPTQVLGLRVDQGDPLSTDPTGLTLQFSAAMNVGGINPVKTPPLILVDQDGKSWPLLATAYDAGTAQISLAFEQTLSPGLYNIEEPSQGGLLDLAGRAPVASGLPDGILGTFAVSPSETSAADLGTIRPGPQGSGIASTLVIGAGQTETRSFVTTELGVYRLEGIDPTGGVRFAIEDSSGDVLSSGPVAGNQGRTLVDLPPGVYQMVFTGGLQESSLSFTIDEVRTRAEVFLTSGVSQGPALNIRLVNPQANFAAASIATTGATPAATVAGTPSTDASQMTDPDSSTTHTSPTDQGADPRSVEAAATTALGVAVPLGPSLSGLASSVGLLGRPSATANLISVVGTSSPTGLAAVASNSREIPTGLFSGQDPIELDLPLDSEAVEETPKTKADPSDGFTLEGGVLSRDQGSDRADDRSLIKADGIGGIVEKILTWLESRPVKAEEPGEEAVSSASNPAEAGESPEMPAETASIASPLGLGLVCGLLAYRFGRQQILRYSGTAAKESESLAPSILKGPHRQIRVRVSGRVGKGR